MPTKPKTHKPPGAGQHSKRSSHKAHDWTRLSSTKRGYDRTWRKLRKLQLAEQPLCEHCYRNGQWVPAEHVDHVKPISRGGARLDQSNLQSLCARCHSIKTAKERAR